MNTELGLVCLSTDRVISFKTITKKRYDTLSFEDQCNTLKNIYNHNLNILFNACEYCVKRNIFLYRISSEMFPFGDTELGRDIINYFFKQRLQEIGLLFVESGIRLTFHPPLFVSLNSENNNVVDNSINILQHHAHIMDLMNLEQSRFNLINIHATNKNNWENLISVINDLPENIKSRLTLENDEYVYSVYDLLKITEKTDISIVFDLHHALVHHKLPSYDDKEILNQFSLSRQTWEDTNIQLCHLSNGKEGLWDRKHSDMIHIYPNVCSKIPYLDIEAKNKELAINEIYNFLYK